jgi:hypothetical protein
MKLQGLSRKIRLWSIGLILACLTLCMSACGLQQPIVRTEYVYILPPEQYLQEYEVPVLAGDRNRDLRDWALGLWETNRLHRSDKQALREWREEVSK